MNRNNEKMLTAEMRDQMVRRILTAAKEADDQTLQKIYLFVIHLQ